MAFRKILKFPDQELFKKSKPVVDIDDGIVTLADDLRDTLNVAGGVGLAAPQIGVLHRVIYVVCDAFSGVMINPVIKETHDFGAAQEQCLSFPGVSEIIPRYSRIVVEYKDLASQQHTSTFTNLAAQIIQHEIDHLDGRLIIHHLSHLKQNIVRRRVNKVKNKVKKMLKSSDTDRKTRTKTIGHLSKKEIKLRLKRRKQNL